MLFRSIGPNGLIQRAEEAGRNYQNAAEEEEKQLAELMNMMNGDKEETNEEVASEDIYVSLNGNTLSFYNNEEVARANADSDAHYYGNIKGTEAPWRSEKEIIEQIQIVNRILPTERISWFRDLTKLREIQSIEKIDTSKVTNMGAMFYECNSLTSLDLSRFDTSRVTNMENMFFWMRKINKFRCKQF